MPACCAALLISVTVPSFGKTVVLKLEVLEDLLSNIANPLEDVFVFSFASLYSPVIVYTEFAYCILISLMSPFFNS